MEVVMGTSNEFYALWQTKFSLKVVKNVIVTEPRQLEGPMPSWHLPPIVQFRVPVRIQLKKIFWNNDLPVR
jgi:hypothetical protein